MSVAASVAPKSRFTRLFTRAALVAGAAVLLTTAGVSPASATNVGTVPGDGNSTACSLDWTARTTLNTDLRDNDATYPNLMTDLNGDPVTSYSNGGYIEEVRPEAGGLGVFELNHWYVGNEPAGPTTTTATTPVHWRIPIATDNAVTGAQLTFTIPRGSNFTFRSGQNIATWGAPYGDYTWGNPTVTPTASADGLTWSVYLGDLAAMSGVVVQFDGTVPAGTVLSMNSVGSAHLTAAYPPGTGTCPATPPATSGNDTTACVVDWHTDATETVADGTKAVQDVTRDEVVSPELGDPGKFGIDGWTTVGGTPGSATINGRFVLASDVAMSNVKWVLHFDEDILNPTLTVRNADPALAWRTDGLYPNPVTIDAGVWDAAAHTMTYTVTMPAWSNVIVQYSGASASGSYVSGAAYTNTATLTGSYAIGAVEECVAPSTQTPDPEAPGAATPGDLEELPATGAGDIGIPLAVGALALALGVALLARRRV